MSRRVFTVDEVEAMLPHLEGVFRKLEEMRGEAQQHHDRMQVLELLWSDRLREPDNPDHDEGVLVRGSLLATVRGIERTIRDEIITQGIRFPAGGLEKGLVDFPTTWEGRWVYLCWCRGEPTLSAWHEIDAGFAGRQAITAEHRRRMGREDDPELLDDSRLDF